MKKKSTFLKKTTTSFIIMVFMFYMGGMFNSSTTANNKALLDIDNILLKKENNALKIKYIQLEKKLSDMENMIMDIKKYDNVIYSQVLGVDFDTVGFFKYRYDSIDINRVINDTIFSNVNERSIYAAELLSIQLSKLKETSVYLKNNKNLIKYYPNISPIKTINFITITSPYGWRDHPTKKTVLFHDGIDISAIKGSEIYSTAKGIVTDVVYSNYGYGNKVIIEHKFGFETLYAHMESIIVKKGQKIKKGQLIGTVGNTGTSTGPHLHYEIRKNGVTRDPLGYFFTYLTEDLLADNN